MRQQFDRGFPVADEIVVDEIDRVGHPAFAQPVEFCDDLLRRLKARVAAIQPWNVAEFALIGAAAGILDAAEKISFDLGKLVGRNWKLGHRHPIGGLKDDLPLRTGRISRQPRDQLIGRITEFTDMEIIERGIVVRAGAHRRAADRHGQIERMRAAADVVHLLALDVHARDEYRFRPLEVFLRGRADILIDEADLPIFRQIGRNQQQALWRHKGLHAVGEGVGIFERTESRRVARKHAQDAPNRLDALSSHSTSPARPCKSSPG